MSRESMCNSWSSYLASAPDRLTLAGFKVAARDLTVQRPFDLLFGEAPPPTSVRTWSRLTEWLSRTSTYAAVCRRQRENSEALGIWWSMTWSVCQHQRRPNLLPHPCQLCGDTLAGWGCLLCHTHVCQPCLTLRDCGWPSGRNLAQRARQRRNLSLRGILQVREALDTAALGLDPLEHGDITQALVALWIKAHASEGGSAERFLLAPWL